MTAHERGSCLKPGGGCLEGLGMGPMMAKSGNTRSRVEALHVGRGAVKLTRDRMQSRHGSSREGRRHLAVNMAERHRVRRVRKVGHLHIRNAVDVDELRTGSALRKGRLKTRS
jgi:hypothetical protein